MVNKGRLDPLKTFWEREGSNINGIDAPVPEWTGERSGTLLQVATSSGHEEVTRWLLEVVHADPTIEVPLGGPGDKDEEGYISNGSDSPVLASGLRRTAYDLAKTRGVRNVFRRCAAEHPEWWDWFGAGRVPSALSREMEEEREEKKKVRRKGLKDRVKEREAREREKAKDRPAIMVEQVVEVIKLEQEHNAAGPRKLGGWAGTVEGVAGLTPEMRIKVERERRARAAEARLKR